MTFYGVSTDRAKALIDKYGRSVTLTRFRTTPANAQKPWQGPSDPRSPLLDTITLNAVFLDPLSYSTFGVSFSDSDLVKRSSQILLISTGSADQTNLGDFNEVIDEGKNFKIVGVEALKPGDTNILYFIGIAR